MTTLTPLKATDFNRKINFWGRLTMGIGILISIGAPLYMMLAYGLWPGWEVIGIAFVALAAVVAVSWVVEPLTYFPMLGVAGTYQAWLVGNISNKLLPAAITAQTALGLKPGTRKSEIAAISAISGAVIVHVISLILLVGIGGTVIVSILPERMIHAFEYILPAILGPVIVQLCVSIRSVTMPIVGAVVAAVITFLLIPLLPGTANFALLIAVVLTVTASILILRRRTADRARGETEETSAS